MPRPMTQADLPAFFKKQKDRNHREVELLVVIAASPRGAMPILKEMNVTVEEFQEEDTRTLFKVLVKAGEHIGAPMSKVEIFRDAREALNYVRRWDDTDWRPFATGCMIWGPGPLMRLLSCCDFEVHLLRRCIDALRNEMPYATQ